MIKPYKHGVAVVDVTEEKTNHGLYVPDHALEPDVKRGIVQSVGSGVEDDGLAPGMLVYYGRGVRIGDTTIIDAANIIAYDELEDK
jgi:co-chaperonin GroES (HSP10)